MASSCFTLCDQLQAGISWRCALTYPSVTSPVEGVALLEVNLPRDLSWASRSFCSKTSARRLRKSERWTRPTVCDLSRSSADAVWLVNERGVELWLGCSDCDILIPTLFSDNRRIDVEIGDKSHMNATDVLARDVQDCRIGNNHNSPVP